MARKPFIPKPEAQFTEWAANFVHTVAEQPEAYQLSQQEIEELQNEFNQFDKEYKDAIAARDAAIAAVQAKEESRTEFETTLRSTAKRIQADSRVTDPARRNAGLPVHKTTRKPVPVPSSAPVGNVLLTARLEQTLTFADSVYKRRRPEGTIGVQIYMCIGETIAPTNPAAYTFLEACSRSPKLMTFDEEHANKVAHYLLRWVNHKGQTGPWSAPISGTIPAV